MALENLRGDGTFSEEELVIIYWHSRIGGNYYTSEARNRQLLYPDISAHPTCKFDAVLTYTGGGSGVYSAYRDRINQRLPVPTPITIRTNGVFDETGGWVDATFKVVDPVSAGVLRAQFVVIEKTGEHYNWTMRDHLPHEDVVLTAPGDSVVVHREFTITDTPWPLVGALDVVVFIEDMSPHVVYNAQVVPDLYSVQMATTDYAKEIGYLGTATYTATLSNIGLAANVVTVSVNQDVLPDGVGPADWEASFREVGGTWYTEPTEFALGVGEDLDLEVRVVDNIGTAEGMAVTTLSAVSGGSRAASDQVSFSTFVEVPSLLLVADDDGWGWHAWWEEPLSNLGLGATVWIADDRGRPELDLLSSYSTVLWTTGSGFATDLGDDEDVLMSYLDGGGNLYLSSMNYLSSLPGSTTMTTDYMHITSWINAVGQYTVVGVDGDVISDGMVLDELWYPLGNNAEAIVIDSPSETIFTSTSGIQGLKVAENGHKIVFTTFAFESVSMDDPTPSNRTTLLGRILDWFAPAVGVEEGEMHRLAISQNFPNPFNPVTKIAYTVPSGAERVELTILDLSGRVVRSLVDETLPPGPALAVWDGKDDDGHRLASGVYFAKVSAGSESAFTKMTLLK